MLTQCTPVGEEGALEVLCFCTQNCFCFVLIPEEEEGPKGKEHGGDDVAVKAMEQNGDGDCTGERAAGDTKLLQDAFNSDLLCNEHGSFLSLLTLTYSVTSMVASFLSSL